MKLTPTQIETYHQQGYHILGSLLSPEQAQNLGAIYLDCLANHRAQHSSQQVNKLRYRAHDGTPGEVYQLRCAHLMHPEFDALVRHQGLLDAVESLIGPNIRLVICQGLYKPPRTGDAIDWHQDDYYFRVGKANAVVSCWLTFDRATIDNGCMWVAPGAHRRMVEHETGPSGNGFRIPDMDATGAVPVPLEAGECMLHHGLMPHRTLANTTDQPRRALAIHYQDAIAQPSQTRQQEPPENRPLLRGRAAC
ncbi:MAG: hypothetical protein GKR89_06960 [Candidatus Latescibacteria bacterium]|nr:hypothetical protein [Candidatus Latescibacterota bacterium]